jgi:cysteine desulfurase
VLDACARSGYEITAVGVDNCGRFLVEEVIGAFQPETVFLTLQLANHEVGTIQSAIPEILAVAKERGILTHVDARAAAGHLKLDFADLGADLCSITADTWGGPLGSAALLIKRGLRISPLLVGGMQERARRGGSENVAAIVGFGSAANEIWAGDQLDIEARLARQYTDQIIAGSLALPGVQQLGDPKQRLPHLVCIAVNDVESEPILLGLDQHGVAVHSGSSCSSEALEPSPVLTAMGVDADKSLRVSSGWSTTKKDIDTFLTEFPLVLNRLRELRNG